MDIQKIQQYKSAFDLIAKDIKDDEGNSIEVRYARDLQQVLGYSRWENFVVAIGRAMVSCKTLGISIDDHFREVTKMVFQRTPYNGFTPMFLKSTRLCSAVVLRDCTLTLITSVASSSLCLLLLNNVYFLN